MEIDPGRLLKGGAKGLGIATALLGATAAGLWWQLFRRPLPRTKGELRVTGIEGSIEIARDRWGMPTVRAKSAADLWFGQGFCHGQDRLWQCEVNRRICSGRVAEIAGEVRRSCAGQLARPARELEPRLDELLLLSWKRLPRAGRVHVWHRCLPSVRLARVSAIGSHRCVGNLRCRRGSAFSVNPEAVAA
jgi:hypothetical protein